jgi:hypothetical protein
MCLTENHWTRTWTLRTVTEHAQHCWLPIAGPFSLFSLISFGISICAMTVPLLWLHHKQSMATWLQVTSQSTKGPLYFDMSLVTNWSLIGHGACRYKRCLVSDIMFPHLSLELHKNSHLLCYHSLAILHTHPIQISPVPHTSTLQCVLHYPCYKNGTYIYEWISLIGQQSSEYQQLAILCLKIQ